MENVDMSYEDLLDGKCNLYWSNLKVVENIPPKGNKAEDTAEKGSIVWHNAHHQVMI